MSLMLSCGPVWGAEPTPDMEQRRAVVGSALGSRVQVVQTLRVCCWYCEATMSSWLARV